MGPGVYRPATGWSRPTGDVIHDWHVNAINSIMMARSSRTAWAQFLGEPLPELAAIPQDLDLIEDSPERVEDGLRALRELMARLTLIHSGAPSEGYTKLWELRRLDLSVEAIILRPKWRRLFCAADRQAAEKRLSEYGFDVSSIPGDDISRRGDSQANLSPE